MSAMTIYLYVKTHRKTGLKYLGKTQQDPYKYQGSGVYWTRHIQKYGYDVETEIIHECETNEEIKEKGIYYSQLWNIVESDKWANLKEESGDGLSSEDMKKKWSNPDYASKMTEMSQRLWENEDHRKRQSESRIARWSNDVDRRDQQSVIMTQVNTQRWMDEENRSRQGKKISDWNKEQWKNPEYREKMNQLRVIGAKKRTKIYTWENIISGEKCILSRKEFRNTYGISNLSIHRIVNENSTIKGWRLVK